MILSALLSTGPCVPSGGAGGQWAGSRGRGWRLDLAVSLRMGSSAIEMRKSRRDKAGCEMGEKEKKTGSRGCGPNDPSCSQ